MSAPFTVARSHGVPFFGALLDQNHLVSEAMSWLGTPFHPHGRIKFAGVDCVQLAGAIYINVGFLDEFTPPKYSMDGGHHLGESQIVAYIEQTGRFRRIAAEGELMTGDLLAFRIGPPEHAVEHHVGLLLRWPMFIHILRGYRVMEASLYDPTWEKRLLSVWRPLRA